ncbi:hypothetical transcriptional regulatory protein [Mycobacterium tuberculosis GM 1503]|nr:hypothetical transcriptional regulatory protein [Mycobacterium tuberculosis GM 1503]
MLRESGHHRCAARGGPQFAVPRPR